MKIATQKATRCQQHAKPTEFRLEQRTAYPHIRILPQNRGVNK